MTKIIGIWGSNGFVGEELIKILSQKKQIEIIKVDKKQTVEDAVKGMSYAFLALPVDQSMQLVPQLIKKGMRVIDLSGAFRLKDTSIFEKYYGIPHLCPEYLEQAVYGLNEKNRKEIRLAQLISNPGCYATAIELALLPLIEYNLIDPNMQIVIEAVSGYTGAGKYVKIPAYITPYKPNREHQHVPEIEQVLGLNGQIHFFPHIAPWARGIEATIRLSITPIDIFDLYVRYYHPPLENMPYVTIKSEAKKENVIGTNLCQIFPKINKDGEVEISVALDNLGKGAAGQAVQNLITMDPFFSEKVYEDE